MTSNLSKFDPATAGAHDPGQLVILFDNRMNKTHDDKFSRLQSYWISSMYRMGWPSWHVQDLEPGKLRLLWYTVRIYLNSSETMQMQRLIGRNNIARRERRIPRLPPLQSLRGQRHVRLIIRRRLPPLNTRILKRKPLPDDWRQ